MKLSLTRSDLTACSVAVGSAVKAGKLKESSMKEHSTEYKLLQVYKTIVEKLDYATNLLEKEKLITQDVALNRVEVKALIACLVVTRQYQAKIMGEYEKRPDDHESFKNEEGRRKSDYVSRLKARMQDVDTVLTKIKEAL